MTYRTFAIAGACLAVGLASAQPSSAAIISRYDASTLGLAEGASVATWSGTGPALTAAGTAQPTYRATGLNGKPTAEFDGTSDVLKTGAAVNNIKTVVGVGIAAAGADSLAGFVSNGADSRNLRIADGTDFYRSEGHNGDGNDFYRVDGSVAGNDGVYVNNVLSGGFTRNVAHVVLSESDSANSFADFWVGSASASLGRYWKGDISEIITFDTALTADERAGVAHNLSVKWNFASQVPANQAQIDAANALGVVVPEPATLGLLSAGALTLLARRRRHRTA